ncbi:hypothetical protein CR513_05514, partial [Mucuna pruriens]
MVNVNHDTCWIDFGSTIHISNTLQGIENLRKLVESEKYIYLSGRMSSHVETIGTWNLFNLEKKYYVLSFSKNLIYVSRLAPLSFSFNFLDTSFTLSNKTEIIGFGALIDGLYKIKLYIKCCL